MGTFEQIDESTQQINKKGKQKRMISIKYIMKQLFKMLNLNYQVIPVSKCNRTVKNNNKYWHDVLKLKGDKIQAIIKK